MITKNVRGPFLFFGHSMGALVGFETALRLQTLNKEIPKQLFVSGREAPHIRKSHRILHSLSDEELLEELHIVNGTPAELLENPELMELYLPVIRADFQACETYEYKSKVLLKCPITSLGGSNDPYVTFDEIREWASYTTEFYEELQYSGDHFFIRNHEVSIVSHVLKAAKRIQSDSIGTTQQFMVMSNEI